MYSSGQPTLALFPNFVTFLMKSVNSAEFEMGLSINIWSISFGDTGRTASLIYHEFL